MAPIPAPANSAGTFMAWQQNTDGWWGEGEFKAFLDGDKEFPTIKVTMQADRPA